MRYKKLLPSLFFLVFISQISFSQKLFEGKTEGETTWLNVPADQMKYKSNSHNISYYKEHKQRIESKGGSNPYISIVDLDANIRVMLMQMELSGKTMRMATISDAMSPTPESEKIEEIQEFKMIGGHNCQKTISTWTIKGKEYKSEGYICKEYKMASTLRETGIVIASLGVEQTMNFDGVSTMVFTTTSISPQSVSDDMFDMKIPEGYTVTDIRKNKKTESITNNSSSESSSVSEPKASKEQNMFDGKTDSELKKMLNDALTKEDYDTAQSIKEEAANRQKNNKYAKYTDAELKKMLDDSVAKDDFNTAQEIKLETNRRAGK